MRSAAPRRRRKSDWPPPPSRRRRRSAGADSPSSPGTCGLGPSYPGQTSGRRRPRVARPRPAVQVQNVEQEQSRSEPCGLCSARAEMVPPRRRWSFEANMAHSDPLPTQRGSARRDRGGSGGGRFRGSRRDRAGRVRRGVSLHSARAGPHGRGEGSDDRSGAGQCGAVRA